MATYQANIQYGDLQGVTVEDGVYVMEDNKMYTDRFKDDTDPEFEKIQDGNEIEIADSAIALALDYIRKTAKEIPLGSDSAE